MQYSNFAYIYDQLMSDINYSEIVDYIEEILKKNNINTNSKLALDLACGTGNITNELASRGYDMIGIDISDDMLNVAEEKSVKLGNKVLYLCQDMKEFELYGTVDFVTCMFDSLNYILYYSDIKKIFKLVSNYLNPGGAFVFDMNTIHKLSSVLGENTFSYSNDDITYIWENEYDMRKRICDFYLTFFVKHENEMYEKFEEHHQEKGYTIEAIEEALGCADLSLAAEYHKYTFEHGDRKSDRITYVAIKR